MTNLGLMDGIKRGEIAAYDVEASEQFSGAVPGYFSQVVNTGSIVTNDAIFAEFTGSPYGKGIVYNFTNAGNITGGQLVNISGGVAIAAAVLGVAQGVAYGTSNYASGTSSTVPVMIFGLKYLTAADTVSANDWIIVGSVANTIQSGGVSATSFGTCLNGAASGAKALVFIGRF